MTEIQEAIVKRMKCVAEVIDMANHRLQDAPAGRLRSCRVGNNVNFYYREMPESRKGKYIKRSGDGLVCRLAQKEYDEKVLKLANLELGKLNNLKEFYDQSSMESAIQLIHKNKRDKIKPVTLSDEEYVRQWMAQTYKGSSVEADEDLISDCGENMRSKSEVLIANALHKHGIPYHYEKPLSIDGKIIYPDFTVLNVRRRREFIWEHFGLMSDQKYAENAIFKINRYMANGYLPGESFIFSAESESVRFGTRQIEVIIRGYLL